MARALIVSKVQEGAHGAENGQDQTSQCLANKGWHAVFDGCRGGMMVLTSWMQDDPKSCQSTYRFKNYPRCLDGDGNNLFVKLPVKSTR